MKQFNVQCSKFNVKTLNLEPRTLNPDFTGRTSMRKPEDADRMKRPSLNQRRHNHEYYICTFYRSKWSYQ